jgi:cardiolipin synthase A/B
LSLRLLIDADEFWPAAAADIARARERVYVQALTFEADTAGGGLARALLDSPAPDKRVLVDHHSRHIVSDKLWYHPKYFFDSALHAEVRATREMVREFDRRGVGFRYINPIGPFLVRLPMRNHKKLIAVDDHVAYIGGINFGDHNFSWHDMMLRIEDPEVSAFLTEDFRWTWGGRDHGTSRSFPGLELHVLSGQWNELQFGVVLDLIASARHTLYVQSPYLAPPFSEELVRASRRGVKVRIVTPSTNNWKLCQDHILWKAAGSSLELLYYTGRMTHMKAMLVDGQTLVMGSANFELWSYHFQQEYLAVVTDPVIVGQFAERVAKADLARCVPCTDTVTPLKGRLADAQFQLIEKIALKLCGGPLPLDEAPSPTLALDPRPLSD